MADIDVGLAAIVRNISKTAGWTYIVEDNPANASGTIKRVDIYAKWQFTGLQIGIFYSTGTDRFSTRSVTTITTGIVTAGFHSYPLDLSIEAGDRIGFYASSGDNLYAGQSTTTGCWAAEGDMLPCTNIEFYHVTDDPCGLISLYGAYILAVVTTQAVTDITHNSGTGNGNITNINGENCSKRGVCWNTTGSPTVADNKSEESGSFGTGAFTRPMTGLDPGIHYYVKAYAYNSCGYAYGGEVEFTTDKVAPTVTTQIPTDVLPTTATANGNITALGGENATTRGFKYGLTKDPTWDVHDDGSFGAGAYTKAITENLVANTTYWIQAYATNSIGTSYGAWVEFQTAAVGTIPTGTKINICSCYSGCTYKLMRSETDDGEPYTAYFVISTDLSNKQALAFYKRILDLHLYFKSEASGTATIEVKRDNEADWQAVGSVSLTGTAEIIVKHLACRIYGKHFLFKISAANAFRFLGCLFEFLPGGMR